MPVTFFFSELRTGRWGEIARERRCGQVGGLVVDGVKEADVSVDVNEPVLQRGQMVGAMVGGGDVVRS